VETVPQEHLEFLSTSLPYWQTERHAFIHANLEPGVPLAEQNGEWLRWTHLTGFEQPWPTAQTIVCGHTPQRTGRPLVFPGWVCIDTLAFSFGWLTALDVETGEIFQANQANLYRTSWLP
jgi:serine/threonine protein phosphatase 1